jgi:hypothetical protein
MSNPHIRQLLDLIKEQNKAIEKLIAERDSQRQEIDALVGWIQEDRDALMCLQQIYNNPTVDEANRIRAAQAAINFERPKPPTMSVNAGVLDFKEYVRTIRMRQQEKDKARWAAEAAVKTTIEHQPLDLTAEPAPTVLGGPPEEGWDPNDLGHEGEADPAA